MTVGVARRDALAARLISGSRSDLAEVDEGEALPHLKAYAAVEEVASRIHLCSATGAVGPSLDFAKLLVSVEAVATASSASCVGLVVLTMALGLAPPLGQSDLPLEMILPVSQ